MILTINANAAVDMVMFIDRFIPGDTMRPQRVVPSVGGKGTDTAVVLRALGAPVKVVSFTAGRNGQLLTDLLCERQIEVEWIWVEGETRVSNVIVETDFNRHSHITTPGYSVTGQDLARFKAAVERNAPHADWAVIAGSLPAGAPTMLYRELTDLLHCAGVKVLIDCFGQPARDALDAQPDVVKMNQDEFTVTFDSQPDSQAGWLAAVRQVMEDHAIHNFVLTCGQQGILAFTPHAVYQAAAPLMEEVNAAGSGDAVSAAIAYRLSLGDCWEQVLRWAAAAGAAVVLTEGTAECRMKDVQEIYPQTTVRNLG